MAKGKDLAAAKKTYKVQGRLKSGAQYKFLVRAESAQVAQNAMIYRIAQFKASVFTMLTVEATKAEIANAPRIFVVQEEVAA